ncbi:MAG: C40 family peptidase [Actinomycetota bacterium]|nr:C40 family peptidase [Actinomycetota bacterium]
MDGRNPVQGARRSTDVRRLRGPLILCLLALLAASFAACGREPEAKRASKPASPPPEEPGDFDLSSRPQPADVAGAGAAPVAPTGDEEQGDEISPGAQSDEEVRRELKAANKELKRFSAHLDKASLVTGARARVLPDGTAVAPESAPDVVKRVILAGNQIAKFPYKWGGGHGAWRDSGYDCSGSVSFALAGAGLLRSPMASGGFMRWAAPGPGRWITTYANGGHMFMVVAGLRFDTSGRGRAGTRWQQGARGGGGYAVRHPPRF